MRLIVLLLLLWALLLPLTVGGSTADEGLPVGPAPGTAERPGDGLSPP